MHYLIVGTGPSVEDVKGFDYTKLPNNVIIVSVNTSIKFLNYANLWFSIDSSQRNIESAKFAEQRDIPVVWCLKNPKRIKKIFPNAFFIQKKSSENKSSDLPVKPLEWLYRWNSVPKLSENKSYLHNGNSVYSCLNLVYFDKPEKIVILGLDGSTGHSVGGMHKPNNLTHLPLLFASAKGQLNRNNIKVVNGSKNSAITCFERMTPKKALEWISTK